ncbi:McrC family protein [Sphingobium sp. HWE2-09]|uniref:McrC family protein n=1 Tax=Sphingobium sp. HWE2-09 TaxID=3108390 RepID=UPI002DC1B881|nr:McrC family protein [Sphingobium sp. HWE2-09]
MWACWKHRAGRVWKYCPSTRRIPALLLSRALLIRMIGEALSLRPRPGGIADLARFTLPLPEWLAAMFLEEALILVRRGVRQAYQRVDAREPYLRGALDVAAQIRHGPAAAHLFSFHHDVFSFDRPENRLIRSCIDLILRETKSADNWRVARELSILLENIPLSPDFSSDLRAWDNGRLMADYLTIKGPCELILTRSTPFSVDGPSRGLSMLFPMERLFEAYVTRSLQMAAPVGFEIQPQSRGTHLCTHERQPWFELRPDILVSNGQERWIVDAKWKLIHGDRASGYGLSQADFYQLFAYGHRHLEGKGDLHLVYPRTDTFKEPLEPFVFGGNLRLRVVPFDLDERTAPYTFLETSQGN